MSSYRSVSRASEERGELESLVGMSKRLTEEAVRCYKNKPFSPQGASDSARATKPLPPNARSESGAPCGEKTAAPVTEAEYLMF